MIDDVAVKKELLKRAQADGSLSNEAAFRASIEKFQDGVRDHKPMVVDVSTDAEQRFKLDLSALTLQARKSPDPEIRQLCDTLIRIIYFLAHRKEN